MDEEELVSCMSHKDARSKAHVCWWHGAERTVQLIHLLADSLLTRCHYTRQQLRILNCPKQFLHSRNTCKRQECPQRTTSCCDARRLSAVD